MSQSIARQIAGLHQLSVPDLKQRWRDLFGKEPPAYNRAFLIKRLAYRLQELVHGGLPEATKQKMRDILREAGINEDGLAPPKGPGRVKRRDLPVAGTLLVRVWDGQRHEVTVLQDGLEYRDRRYRSLSAIATDITGTHWNGRAFFGLRQKGERAQ